MKTGSCTSWCILWWVFCLRMERFRVPLPQADVATCHCCSCLQEGLVQIQTVVAKYRTQGNGYLFVYRRRSQIASNQKHCNETAELSEVSQERTLNASHSARSRLSPEVRKELGRAHVYLLTFKKHFFNQGFLLTCISLARCATDTSSRVVFPASADCWGKVIYGPGCLLSWPCQIWFHLACCRAFQGVQAVDVLHHQHIPWCERMENKTFRASIRVLYWRCL